jgi:hypothetical protein
LERDDGDETASWIALTNDRSADSIGAVENGTKFPRGIMSNEERVAARLMNQILKLPSEYREEATLEFLKITLATMNEPTVRAFRRAAFQNDTTESVLTLIDGNLALREIFRKPSHFRF